MWLRFPTIVCIWLFDSWELVIFIFVHPFLTLCKQINISSFQLSKIPMCSTTTGHFLQLYLFGESQSNILLPRADCLLFLAFLLLENNVETRMSRSFINKTLWMWMSSVTLKLCYFSIFQITEEYSIEMCYCKLSL